MRSLRSFVLILASVGLVACASSAVNQRAAIERVVRASHVNSGATHIKFDQVRISKLDPQYAIVQEEYTRASGQKWADTWFLRRTDTTWRVTSVENMWPTCSAAPAKVRKELYGSSACFPPVGVYTSIPWTQGRPVRLRYCQRPGGPGNFIAASRGVTCHTAAVVVRAITSRGCYARSQCDVASFRCLDYWAGGYGGRFENDHHAICSSGTRRVEWDGG